MSEYQQMFNESIEPNFQFDWKPWLIFLISAIALVSLLKQVL
jgi:hypothetical protein